MDVTRCLSTWAKNTKGSFVGCAGILMASAGMIKFCLMEAGLRMTHSLGTLGKQIPAQQGKKRQHNGVQGFIVLLDP